MIKKSVLILVCMLLTIKLYANQTSTISEQKNTITAYFNKEYNDKETYPINSWLNPFSTSITKITYRNDIIEIAKYRPKILSWEGVIKRITCVTLIAIIAFIHLLFQRTPKHINNNPSRNTFNNKNTLDEFIRTYIFSFFELLTVCIILNLITKTPDIVIKYNTNTGQTALTIDDKIIQNPKKALKVHYSGAKYLPTTVRL